MSKINMVKSTLSRAAGRGGLLFKKHSPEILMGIGIAGVVVSAVMACKATLKYEELNDEYMEKIGEIKEAKETFPEEKYSERDYKKDISVVYIQRGAAIARLYAPAIAVGAASIGCLIGGHRILQKRNLALVAAYKAIDESFRKYRKRVIEDFGVEKDREYRTGIRHTAVNELDENGKETGKVNIVTTQDPNGYSQYARFFDESSVHWSKTPEYNLMHLKVQQQFANDMLQTRGHVFLNEVYDMLGIERSTEGAVVGWVKGAGDDFIDFGIYNGESERARAFVNGYERSILLDFNVDGTIYDKI